VNGPFRPRTSGKAFSSGAEHLVHHDLAGDAGAQADLSVDRRSRQTFRALVEDEAADLAFVVLGPDHEHIGDRAVGDPHLRAAELVAACDLPGARDHAAGVGAVVRLGQAETADPLAGGEPWQVLLLLCFGAELVDRHHDEGALHAHHRPIAGVDPLHLARDQAVAHVAEAGAAIGFGNRRAEQAELTHLAEDGRIGLLVAKRLQNPRCEPLPAVGMRGIANLALIVRKLLVEQKRVVPMESDALVGSGHFSFPLARHECAQITCCDRRMSMSSPS
jgi:hypothetical protein